MTHEDSTLSIRGTSVSPPRPPEGRTAGGRLDWLHTELTCVPAVTCQAASCYEIRSYNELLGGLTPAPAIVRGRDGDVGHVGIVVQMVHSLPHRLSTDLK